MTALVELVITLRDRGQPLVALNSWAPLVFHRLTAAALMVGIRFVAYSRRQQQSINITALTVIMMLFAITLIVHGPATARVARDVVVVVRH